MSDVPPELARLRSSIDNIDAALVHLLAERFKATQPVGELKAAAGLPPADPEREVEQIARLRALADHAGLDPQFAEKFLSFIIAEVIRHHEAIAGGRSREPGSTPAHQHLASHPHQGSVCRPRPPRVGEARRYSERRPARAGEADRGRATDRHRRGSRPPPPCTSRP